MVQEKQALHRVKLTPVQVRRLHQLGERARNAKADADQAAAIAAQANDVLSRAAHAQQSELGAILEGHDLRSLSDQPWQYEEEGDDVFLTLTVTETSGGDTDAGDDE